jgi:hypothetical protein
MVTISASRYRCTTLPARTGGFHDRIAAPGFDLLDQRRKRLPKGNGAERPICRAAEVLRMER